MLRLPHHRASVTVLTDGGVRIGAVHGYRRRVDRRHWVEKRPQTWPENQSALAGRIAPGFGPAQNAVGAGPLGAIPRWSLDAPFSAFRRRSELAS